MVPSRPDRRLAKATSIPRTGPRLAPAVATALATALVSVLAVVVPAEGAAGVEVWAIARQDASVSSGEAADLSERAVTDDAALVELRAIRKIDGQRVDLRSATAGLGSRRRERLTTLADALRAGGPSGAGLPGGGASASGARRQANDILDQRRYHGTSPPKPFRGVLRWLGDRLDPVLGPIGRFLGRVFRPIVRLFSEMPGGQFLLDALVAALVAGGIVWLVRRRSAARVRGSNPDGRSLLVDPDADPAVLDRQAEEAEAAGDLDLAVRRRYEAGLVRLVRAKRVTLRPETTASRVAAVLGGETIFALTRVFEEVVYGGRGATAADVAAAKAGWLDVLGVKARP